MFVNIEEFIRHERASRDTLDVKRIYIDMADDLAAGILLSQVIYWHLPDAHGKSKLRVFHEGYYWIAKHREDWWDECRISAKQYDRAVAILEDKELVLTDTTMFAGKPCKIVRLNTDIFLKMYEQFAGMTPPTQSWGQPEEPKNRGEERSSPKGKNEIAQTVNSITESTTEINNDNERRRVELQKVVPIFNGGDWQAITDAWDKFPDERRHIEALRQTENAHSRTARVYLKAYLTFNPDWTPPARASPRSPKERRIEDIPVLT